VVRTLFFECPEDPTCWFIEDEYMFGEDILVAPLMEDISSRDVYLPPGRWIDYQTTKTYEGATWHRIWAGKIPVVMLVKEGSTVPHLELTQSTSDMSWRQIELVVFASEETTIAEGRVCLPEEGRLHTLCLERESEGFTLKDDPVEDRVEWRVSTIHA
jgi:alpha-D-xyloside xylohydrolase